MEGRVANDVLMRVAVSALLPSCHAAAIGVIECHVDGECADGSVCSAAYTCVSDAPVVVGVTCPDSGLPIAGEASADGPACDPTMILDDFRSDSGTTATGGYWYTYSDRTCVSYVPPRIRPDAAGTLEPQEGQMVLPSNDGTLTPPCEAEPVPFVELRGGGENIWGAGIGFDFTDNSVLSRSLYDSCPVAEACDGTPAPGADPYETQSGAFNSRVVPGPPAGISFWARAPEATAAVSVEVHLSDRHSNESGGVCKLCLYRPATPGQGECFDDWLVTLKVTDAWEPQTVRFDDPRLATLGWSTTPARPQPWCVLDTTALYSMHFQLSTDGQDALAPFHIQIGYVTWAR